MSILIRGIEMRKERERMKRLTKSGGTYCDNCPATKNEFCACDDEIAMYKKLSEYEDTGFDPNEIRRLISAKDRLPKEE